jgi:hypothetical protein
MERNVARGKALKCHFYSLTSWMSAVRSRLRPPSKNKGLGNLPSPFVFKTPRRVASRVGLFLSLFLFHPPPV